MSVTAIFSEMNPSKTLLVRTFREIFLLRVATLLKSREELTRILAEGSVLMRTTQKPIVPVITSLQPCITRLSLRQDVGNCFSVCSHSTVTAVT